jgi:hypothetical protein
MHLPALYPHGSRAAAYREATKNSCSLLWRFPNFAENSQKKLDGRGNICIQYTVIQSDYAFRKEEKRI